MEKVIIPASEIEELVKALSYRIRLSCANLMDQRTLKIFGVPRGGIPVAMALVPMLNAVQVDNPEDADVIVDDIVDSGATLMRYRDLFPKIPFYAMIGKLANPKWTNRWVVLPWEVTEKGADLSADDIVVRLLEFIGEEPLREGLKETPRRVLKAWQEWAQGYKMDPLAILKTFEDGAKDCDELVIVSNIPIISKCEHHLADITGIAHIGYIPNGRIVGLSKLARVADLFARRLQVQERLTNQIANALIEGLEPKGVGVIIRAAHACMSSRGVKVHGAITTTSAMRGALLDKPAARAEFMALCDAAERAVK